MEIQTMMRGLWVDDVRNPPQFIYKNKNVKWVQVRSVEEAKYCIRHMESINYPYNLISMTMMPAISLLKVATTSNCSIGLRRLVATILFGFIRKMLQGE